MYEKVFPKGERLLMTITKPSSFKTFNKIIHWKLPPPLSFLMVSYQLFPEFGEEVGLCFILKVQSKQ